MSSTDAGVKAERLDPSINTNIHQADRLKTLHVMRRFGLQRMRDFGSTMVPHQVNQDSSIELNNPFFDEGIRGIKELRHVLGFPPNNSYMIVFIILSDKLVPTRLHLYTVRI